MAIKRNRPPCLGMPWKNPNVCPWVRKTLHPEEIKLKMLRKSVTVGLGGAWEGDGTCTIRVADCSVGYSQHAVVSNLSVRMAVTSL